MKLEKELQAEALCIAGEADADVIEAAAKALARLANLDLGSDPALWRAWWKDNEGRDRQEWVAAGFRAAGYPVGSPLRLRHVHVLLEAVGAAEPHLSENARRALMRLLRRSARKQLMWPPEDAAWWWRKKTPRRLR